MSSMAKPLDARLSAKVQIDPIRGCWLWTGYLRDNGYASVWVNEAQKKCYAHRVAYELFVGPIPEGMQIDHLCRVRHCINPEHLEAVTPRENLLRGETSTAKYAAQTSCINGHEFNKQNTYKWRGSRYCRPCRAERERRRREQCRSR